MENTEQISLPQDFEKQISDKIEILRNYYKNHNYPYEGLDDEVNATVELINKLPESKNKHGTLADVYSSTCRSQGNKWDYYQKKALEEAEIYGDAEKYYDIWAGSPETRLLCRIFGLREGEKSYDEVIQIHELRTCEN